MPYTLIVVCSNCQTQLSDTRRGNATHVAAKQSDGLDPVRHMQTTLRVCLCDSGLVGAALAAPYCCKHSMATLMRPGPRPVRTPQFLQGLPSNSIHQQLNLQESATVHDRARLLLSAVCCQNGLVILENPAASITWLDPFMWQWIFCIAPFVTHASTCKFGSSLSKIWCSVFNEANVFSLLYFVIMVSIRTRLFWV